MVHVSQTRAFKQGADPKPFNGEVAERGEGEGKDESKDIGAEHRSLTLRLLEETHLGFHVHPISNPTTKANHPVISPMIMLASKAIVKRRRNTRIEEQVKGYRFKR